MGEGLKGVGVASTLQTTQGLPEILLSFNVFMNFEKAGSFEVCSYHDDLALCQGRTAVLNRGRPIGLWRPDQPSGTYRPWRIVLA